MQHQWQCLLQGSPPCCLLMLQLPHRSPCRSRYLLPYSCFSTPISVLERPVPSLALGRLPGGHEASWSRPLSLFQWLKQSKPAPIAAPMAVPIAMLCGMLPDDAPNAAPIVVPIAAPTPVFTLIPSSNDSSPWSEVICVVREPDGV